MFRSKTVNLCFIDYMSFWTVIHYTQEGSYTDVLTMLHFLAWFYILGLIVTWKKLATDQYNFTLFSPPIDSENGDCLLHGFLHKLGGPFQSVWTKKYFFLYPNRLEYRGEQAVSEYHFFFFFFFTTITLPLVNPYFQRSC